MKNSMVFVPTIQHMAAIDFINDVRLLMIV